ncbi:D-alanyl-D-alanine carboxypeptidase/D-alanyl-D-alanine-endopeptidase [Streptacidiphilus pinicola]|uniref:D-alanyl-D-alanine carboxypeptidase/D-alanyl-D-alanine-endopeptidase n=1 Tax=Streptacidiphilus pinicola TaxID=2219663 RepID=A0A2X0IR18_9ACTN|nr:D-alanyl-D-alanine carboxypeptidase/D-alanyl-D-alanine-endopeptidase [Streptacidiphilus pinicola]RAG87672.1 D-alanyl-D-alanine carboxypeptidase/D-alanyl-D-alanine-endopeptidase [Streptacidiphilus pinicola]
MGNWADRGTRTFAAARRYAAQTARQAAQQTAERTAPVRASVRRTTLQVAQRTAERTGPVRVSALRSARRVGRRYAYAPTRWVVGVAAGSGLVLAVVSIAAAGPWQGGQRASDAALAAGHPVAAAHHPGHPPAPRPAGPAWHDAADVLAPAGAAGTLPTGAGLGGALAGALADPALGKVTASVVDVSDGRTLYSVGADQDQEPASTNKIATATAALSLLGPDHRFTTEVVGDASTGLTLVGGGDPTLSASTGPDSLTALAAATAAALHAAAAASPSASPSSGTHHVSLHYDISLFSQPALHPIGVNDNIALVQALTSDEGRLDPTSTENAPRYADPAAHAASVFAAALAADGVDVDTAPTQATAPAHAPVLAQVQSGPLSGIVERMLTESDNDVAEALGHAVALASGKPATFTDAAASVTARLSQLGVRLGATHLSDSSGLSSADGIPAAVLTQLLVLDASPAHPELRSVLSGLPIAGFTGTLDNRYGGDGSEAGLGVVRAKTGTLSTVNTLAGLVVDRSGRLLAFAFMSNGGGGADAARAALDRLAAGVATCGCD